MQEVVAARVPGRGRVRVNLAESPLGWLHARGLIDDRQAAAGEALRAAYEAAALGARVTMNWGAVRVDGTEAPVEPGVRQLSAKRRFDEAIAAVGPGLADVLWRVVCAGEGMAEAERALSWPARSGRVVLTLALDRLAAHFRIG